MYVICATAAAKAPEEPPTNGVINQQGGKGVSRTGLVGLGGEDLENERENVGVPCA